MMTADCGGETSVGTTAGRVVQLEIEKWETEQGKQEAEEQAKRAAEEARLAKVALDEARAKVGRPAGNFAIFPCVCVFSLDVEGGVYIWWKCQKGGNDARILIASRRLSGAFRRHLVRTSCEKSRTYKCVFQGVGVVVVVPAGSSVVFILLFDFAFFPLLMTDRIHVSLATLDSRCSSDGSTTLPPTGAKKANLFSSAFSPVVTPLSLSPTDAKTRRFFLRRFHPLSHPYPCHQQAQRNSSFFVGRFHPSSPQP